ncbi:MAG: hypothetical protein ACFFB0_15650 [Promethearchaeota archaeon]
MKDLLKSFNLSEEAIKIYLECAGDIPYTFREFQKIIPDSSEEKVKEILEELIEKKLVLLITPKYSESIPHYIIIPPFSAILNSIIELTNIPEDENIEDTKRNPQLDKFQDDLYKDLEIISQELIDAIGSQENSNQTTEILSEVEGNVKKFGQIILNDVIEMISQLKRQYTFDGDDLKVLINSVKEKITESEEIVANMFSQFRNIVNEMSSPDTISQVEAFKTFIRKLGESIDKRTQELSLGRGSLPQNKIDDIENSLYSAISNYISKNKDSLKKFWSINSVEKIKEILSVLLEKCTDDLTIIVPNIEYFIPLEKFNLDYSEDLSEVHKNQNSTSKKSLAKKSLNSRPSITKKQKKELTEKFDLAAKKVAELKGFELSHNITDLLAFISEINPDSTVIESIQGWLNRLLIIRKHLDSNTQYLLLEAIEKWKKDYYKVKKKEEQPEAELVDESNAKLSEKKSLIEKDKGEGIPATGLSIKIIASDSHDNKHALAFSNKVNIEYRQLKNNDFLAVIGDNSYLIFGICLKTSNKSKFEISGFFSTYKPLIELVKPLIAEQINNAKLPKEIEINRDFNEIIENINDFTGRKISKKLKRLIDVAFEKDGISLNILELKLLTGKLEKLYTPLNDEMKKYVIKELDQLNNEFSTLELEYPPEFRPPIVEEEKGDLEQEMKFDEIEIEPVETEKINNLFEILIEKVDELKGVEIGEQIDKFIEIILKLQGFSNIIKWKDTLATVNETLEEPFKEKLKEDLQRWKLCILKQALSPSQPLKEKHPENYEDSYSTSPQESTFSILEETYISPGLTQSQFPAEEESHSVGIEGKKDPKTEMKELFKEIQTKLGELSGTEISKKLQNIVDVILETEGYSIALKGIKDWISKLRMIRGLLESEIKEDFDLEFQKWKEKYSAEENRINLNFSPSLEVAGDSTVETEDGIGVSLDDRFNSLIQNVHNLKGDELSNELQGVADVLLQSHGAVAVNVIRQWISKLRSIKELLGDEIKEEFLAELEIWKEKYS